MADEGALINYGKQIAGDSVNRFNAQYNRMMSDDLGLEWYQYTGSLITTSRPFCKALTDKRYFHISEIEELLRGHVGDKTVALNKKTDLPEGMIEGTTPQSFFVNRGGWNCGHQIFPVPQTNVPRDVMVQHEVDNVELTPSQQKEFDVIPRNDLKGEEAKQLQEDSVKHFVQRKEELTANYLKDNGNVVNTDEARKQFIDIGYNGSNSAAVHEASSALSKEALNKLIAEGVEDRVSFYAGGSGSCKTSTIETLLPKLKGTSDAIIDGNLSNYEKAIFKIDEYLALGKDIEIAYVYRDPVDAWEAVIKRMLYNPSELGRTVPSSTFLKNTEGSYRTVSKMIQNKKLLDNEKFNLYIFDNSLGKGNARWMDLDRFESITFDPNLKQKVRAITDRYYAEGKITKAQYEELIQ